MNTDFADKGKPELMSEILDAIGFDVIKIVYTDTNNKVLLEDLTLDRTGIPDTVQFEYRSLEKMIRVLGRTGKSIILTQTLTRVGQDVLIKINLQYAIEVFAPLLNGMSQIAGFIYMARQSGVVEIERNGQYIYSMRLLIHIIERELFQKKIRENLRKTVLMLGEIINAKHPMLIANNYAVSYWAVRIAKKIGLSEVDPYGLKGEEIPLLSRVLGVAKEVTIMLSGSRAKKVLPMDEMIHSLKAASGTQFDARVTDAAIALLLAPSDEDSGYFDGLGTYATLSLTKNMDSASTVQMWGQVRKINNIYVFNPLESMPAMDDHALFACRLYLNVDEHIHQFQAEMHQILPDRILLKKVVPQQEADSFSVLWFMEGAFISSNKVIYRIYINLLGGDYLDFYILNDEHPEDISSGWSCRRTI